MVQPGSLGMRQLAQVPFPFPFPGHIDCGQEGLDTLLRWECKCWDITHCVQDVTTEGGVHREMVE